MLGAFVLFTLLALVFILRAPLLALLAVGLNLASVAAAIGVMTLVCQIPAGYPLGGHPYVDTVGAGAIFGVTFGLSIDYAVFLIARMRERYEVDGDNRAAIAFGLEKTAGVITGAAAIMAAVFVAFATAPIATVSQMGVGLTVAILLDATVVRIVLLPALMLLIGDRVWRVPPLLDRILPRRNVLSARAGRARDRRSRPEMRGEEVNGMEASPGKHRRRWIAAALVAVLLAAAATAAAAEAPTREEYVARLEGICKPDAEATQRAMSGRALGHPRRTARRSPPASSPRRRRSSARPLKKIAPVSRPPADAAKLSKWFGYLKAQESYLGQITAQLRADHAIQAQRLTARFIHNGNLANNTVLAFGFDSCSFKFSRYG